jgi:hypothetical protein
MLVTSLRKRPYAWFIAARASGKRAPGVSAAAVRGIRRSSTERSGMYIGGGVLALILIILLLIWLF